MPATSVERSPGRSTETERADTRQFGTVSAQSSARGPLLGHHSSQQPVDRTDRFPVTVSARIPPVSALQMPPWFWPFHR